jgi:chitin disaccharide deacetylase
VTEKKYLIVNADDFGRSSGVNRGIIAAHEKGIVTSASLMVRWPAAVEAAAYGREHPELSLGLHLDLGEWFYRDHEWAPEYEVVPWHDATKVAEEIAQQLAAFRRLFHKAPTHIDSHQHVHLREPVRSILLATARNLRARVRQCDPDVHYCGRFYGQTAEGKPWPAGIATDTLIGILRELKPGITELGCHPGDGDDLDSVYLKERVLEVDVLCDLRVRAAIENEHLVLCSFAGLPLVSSDARVRN